MAQRFPMPSRLHHSAPKYDGNPALLYIFFDDIDQLAETCHLSESQKIKWAIRYAPSGDRELWEYFGTSSTWIDFQTNIRVLYPGSDRDRLYSHDDLTSLTETYAATTMDSTESFGKYYRAFCKISYFLKSKNRISDDEISIQFMSGFNFAFRKKIDAQLRAETPTHHPDDPYELSRIYSAAVFILSCKFYDEKIGINSIQETSDSKKRTSYFSTDTCI